MTNTYCHDGYCSPVRQGKEPVHYKMEFSKFMLIGIGYLFTLIALGFAIRAILEKVYTIIIS